MPRRSSGRVASLEAREDRRGRPRRLFAAAVLGLSCVLAGCGQCPEEQLADATQRAASWSAAAQMAGESWLAGLVPRRYAEATAQAVQRGIEKERARLAKSPATLSDPRVGPAARDMSELSATASRLWDAVQSGDRDRAAQLSGEIGARGRALRDAGGGR